MLIATLGGLIKDHRIRKRVSQLEVSLRIGWQDTSRLSKIEQGRVGKPARETIEKIIKALELNPQEKGEFLFAGGYLPLDSEIKQTIAEIADKIDHWPYPAYLMDFSFRWLYTNIHTLKTAGLPPKFKKVIIKNSPNFLEFPFLPKEQFNIEVSKGEDINNLKPFQIAQIAAFKTENLHYQNESWYKSLIRSLMKYEDFRELWPKISLKDYHKRLFDYEYKRMTGKYNGKKQSLDFHLQTARLITDPRFQIVLYYPANSQTEEFFQIKYDNIYK